MESAYHRQSEETSRRGLLSRQVWREHLQVLTKAGLVAATRDGTRVRYRLASPAVYQFWVAPRSTLREHGYAARYLSDGLPEWAAAWNGVESVLSSASSVDR